MKVWRPSVGKAGSIFHRAVCKISAGRSGDLLSMIVETRKPRDIKAKLETSLNTVSIRILLKPGNSPVAVEEG